MVIHYSSLGKLPYNPGIKFKKQKITLEEKNKFHRLCCYGQHKNNTNFTACIAIVVHFLKS